MEDFVFSGGCFETSAMSQNSTNSSSSTLYFPNHYPNWESLHDNQRVLPVEEDKSSASRSHSEAEKRRRDRINAQLATLRKLIPNSEKMDKAVLLGSAIEQVKEMRTKAIEINKVITIPSDIDELIIVDNNLSESGCKVKKNISIKVSFCCEDRPELFSDLSRALKVLKLQIVEAELTCLAGRIKGVFCITAMHSMDQEKVCMDNLRKSLKLSLNRVVMSYSTSNYIIKSKRRRFFFPQSD
ncbi:basic helix-loop-helix transcription factor [Lithospermum erythrorhizon]|uniref:Basic helix-loop-helix transcription factor n=1 Tax=Lithospermum erythrorhizon TaxID=34254 RepID=A0AAV3PCK4_LITER